MKSRQKHIALSLITQINKIQREEQMQENIKKGRKAKVITFIDASNMLAKRFTQ